MSEARTVVDQVRLKPRCRCYKCLSCSTREPVDCCEITLFLMMCIVLASCFIHLFINLSAKRPRRASLKTDNEPEPKLQSATSIGTPKSSSRRQKFLDLFEDEVAKDIVWWLPGRRGEAFALNRERFERELIKKKFQGQTFVNFLANLSRW